MPPRVYVETSVWSYLSARPSRDIVIAGHQQSTTQWWRQRREFLLFVSPLVLQEASAGDRTMAAKRLAALEGAVVLDVDERAERYAASLIGAGLVPRRALIDALHIAVATVNGMNYLLSWNLKHIANVTLREQVDAHARKHGYLPPVITTPELLQGGIE